MNQMSYLANKNFRRIFGLAIATCAVLSINLATAADDWGTIKGRFVFKGTAPTPMKITPDKDVAVCGKHPLVDESLVIGKSGELANVFVYSRTSGLAVHPEYKETAEAKLELDNKFCRYAPHASVLRTSQTLVLKNTDSVAHNVKADLIKNGSFNVLIPPNAEVPKNFTIGETLPSKVGCNIHPWMSGVVLIREDPYMTVSAADGTFEIKNLPVGEVEIQMWQEKSGYLDGVMIDGKPAKRGRFTLKVKPGVLDLGDIVVDAKLFKGK
jgi:hypothetical protein